jgi:hypothetical protein
LTSVGFRSLLHQCTPLHWLLAFTDLRVTVGPSLLAFRRNASLHAKSACRF